MIADFFHSGLYEFSIKYDRIYLKIDLILASIRK